MDGTVKQLVKFGNSMHKCFDKCFERACTPPRGERPSCLPDGTFWANLVGFGGMGNVPLKYCNSPSGAFVE